MRYFISLLITVLSLYAQKIEAKYDVTYGLFGKVGKSTAKLIKNEKNYKIEIYAKATGLAKILSKGRKERYISEGRVENGVLVPEVFKKIRENETKKDIKIYRFDHEKKKIFVHREIYKEGKLDKRKDEFLKFYAKDDILSLFFNIKRFVNFKKSGKKIYNFYAVGGRRGDGLVNIELPTGETLKKVKDILEEDGIYLIVTIYQKIFASKEGKLYIVLNDEGIAKKAVLKDVIMFGDITGKLKKLRIEK